MDDAGDWRRLCALLDEDESVLDAVEEALEQEDDPWEALLDGLDDAGALAYLQAEDTGMELTDALVQLPRVYALQPDLDAVTDTDDLVEAIALADAGLEPGGLRLLRFVEADDDESRPLVVVPEAHVAEIQRLAVALGGQVALAR